MANQEIKNNGQGVHDHGALNGDTNNDRDIADKKAISDLDKKGNPEDAQLFKDKLLGKSELLGKKHAKDNIDSGHSKFFGKADGMSGRNSGDVSTASRNFGNAQRPSDLFLESQNRISRFNDNYRRDSVQSQSDDVNNRYAHGNVGDHDSSAQQVAGNVILDSIQAQRISQSASEKAAAAIRDVGVQVAERIIATNEALNAKQEVRITIQNNILKDTEVFISKDGKQINVNFVTGASESADILNQRSGELRSQLMENLKDVDYVEVNIEDQSGQNDDNQENDGHSRNQDNQQGEQEDN